MNACEKDIYLAIIAGGQGTRLFPLSHPDCPKQFCVLREDSSGSTTFIQDTAKRFVKVGIRPQNIVVITTNDRQSELAKEQLTPFGIIEPNIIQISADYGYASSMLKATEFCSHLNSEAIVVNPPADQYIEGEKFKDAIVSAANNARNGHPTVVGVKVQDLNTFIGCGHARYIASGGPIFKIDGFVEKPTVKKASAMMRAGNTACNTGINVWRAKDTLAAVKMTEIVETNISDDVCCGFIGPRASKHQIVPIKLSKDEILIQISGESSKAKTA